MDHKVRVTSRGQHYPTTAVLHIFLTLLPNHNMIASPQVELRGAIQVQSSLSRQHYPNIYSSEKFLTSLNEVELTQLPSVGQAGSDSGTVTAPAAETPANVASKPVAAAAIACPRLVGPDDY